MFFFFCSDLKNKLGIATELRDSVDNYQKDNDSTKLFEVLLPCFMDILRDGKPHFVSNSLENVCLYFNFISRPSCLTHLFFA